jgi:hypothetical protein
MYKDWNLGTRGGQRCYSLTLLHYEPFGDVRSDPEASGFFPAGKT